MSTLKSLKNLIYKPLEAKLMKGLLKSDNGNMVMHNE